MKKSFFYLLTFTGFTSRLLKAGFHLTFSDELSNATYENDVISLELAYTHRIYLSLL